MEFFTPKAYSLDDFITEQDNDDICNVISFDSDEPDEAIQESMVSEEVSDEEVDEEEVDWENLECLEHNSDDDFEILPENCFWNNPEMCAQIRREYNMSAYRHDLVWNPGSIYDTTYDSDSEYEYVLDPIIDPAIVPVLERVLDPALVPVLERILDPVLAPFLDPVIEYVLEPISAFRPYVNTTSVGASLSSNHHMRHHLSNAAIRRGFVTSFERLTGLLNHLRYRF